MGGEAAPEAVLRPGVMIGILSGVSRAVVAGTAAAMLLMPIAWALELPAGRVSAVLIGLGVLVAVLRAVVRRYTVEYRVYEKRIEVSEGLWRTETRIAPRAEIRYVSLSAGVLPGHVGGGDVVVTVRRPNTKFRLQLTDIADANHWYEQLRPVESGPPVGQFERRIGPTVLTTTGYLVGTVGAVGALLVVAATVAVPTLSPSLVALWAGSICFVGAAWQFLYVASIEYRIHEDHIERCRIFLGAERSYAIPEHINTVEHVRDVPEQLFDVGTVEMEIRWRDGPFHLRSVDGSDELYRELRQSA